MNESAGYALQDVAGARIRAARDDLSRRWLDAVRGLATSPIGISAAVARSANRGDIHASGASGAGHLHDAFEAHAAALIGATADFLAGSADAAPTDASLVAAATHLAAELEEHDVAPHVTLEGCQLLASVLCDFTATVAREQGSKASLDDVLRTMRSIHRAVGLAAAVAASRSVHAVRTRLAEHEERLRSVRGGLSHELKNRIGAVIGAGQLLQEEWIDAAERTRFAAMVVENAEVIRQAILELSALVRPDAPAGASARSVEAAQG